VPTTLYFAGLDSSLLFNAPWTVASSSKTVFKVGITQRSFKERFQGFLDKVTPLRLLYFEDGRDAYLREGKVINYDWHLHTRERDYPPADKQKLFKINQRSKSRYLSKNPDYNLKEEERNYNQYVSRLGPTEWVFHGMSESEALNIFSELCDWPPYFEGVPVYSALHIDC
jgi:hypothetical protein